MTQSQLLAKPKAKKARPRKSLAARSAATGKFLSVTKKPSGPTLRTEARGLKFPFVPIAKS